MENVRFVYGTESTVVLTICPHIDIAGCKEVSQDELDLCEYTEHLTIACKVCPCAVCLIIGVN